MTTKTLATAVLTAGMVFGSLTAAHAGCNYGTGQSKPANQSTPTSS
ncbi:MAG: hypothetical protein AB8B85_00810 [Paracoccaceae bacterium]